MKHLQSRLTKACVEVGRALLEEITVIEVELD